jgi:hypothetical protein
MAKPNFSLNVAFLGGKKDKSPGQNLTFDRTRLLAKAILRKIASHAQNLSLSLSLQAGQGGQRPQDWFRQ